ncbi:MAG: ATP synthase F0 subunit C [Candidatus Cloacimonadia bacterium]
MDSIGLVSIASYLGAGLGIGLSSIGAGVGEGYIAATTSEAIMRQPKAGESLMRNMLIGQALTETGAIFALVVAILLLFGGLATPDSGIQLAAAALGAGLAIGIGSIGPGFGNGYIGAQACAGIGRQPRSANTLTANMLIGQALSQTSAIFALVISMLLMFSITPGDSLAKALGFVGAALAMGFGAFGPGIGVGLAAGKGVEGISRYPKHSSLLTRTMLVGSAVAQSTSIYSLVIALLLIFVT